MNNWEVRIAVIGCGRKATVTHLPILSKLEKIELKYLVDVNEEKLNQLKKQYEQCEVLTDYRQLLNHTDIDAVIICTHTHLHYEIAKAFLLAGIDVFTEKPVAMNFEQANELWQIAAEKGRVLDAGVCLRFSNTLQKVRNIILSGEIGEVYHVSCRFRYHKSIPGIGSDYTDKTKSGGGVLMDLGIHNLDAIDYCLGGVNWEKAHGKCLISPLMKMKSSQKDGYVSAGDSKTDVEDYVFGYADSGKVTLSFEGSWAQNIADEEKYIDFLGDKGAVRFTYYKGFCVWKDGKIAEIADNCYDGKMYQNEFESFADDVLMRKTDSKNAVFNTLRTVKLIDMIYMCD